MRVVCRYGHFAFYPAAVGEVQRFMRIFDLPIYPENDYFTFEPLLALPRWSQTGLPFGGLPAITTYEARNTWEVMEQNEFVFSLGLETLVPVSTIVQAVSLSQTQDTLVAPAVLVQPGAFIEVGVRLTSYHGEIDLQYQRLYIYARETSI